MKSLNEFIRSNKNDFAIFPDTPGDRVLRGMDTKIVRKNIIKPWKFNPRPPHRSASYSLLLPSLGTHAWHEKHKHCCLPMEPPQLANSIVGWGEACWSALGKGIQGKPFHWPASPHYRRRVKTRCRYTRASLLFKGLHKPDLDKRQSVTCTLPRSTIRTDPEPRPTTLSPQVQVDRDLHKSSADHHHKNAN